jgi:general secretion pathway protein C
MSLRWVSFVLWALVAASAVAWGLKLFVTAPPAPRDVHVADASQALRGDVTRVLGADIAPPAEEEQEVAAQSTRFQLVGVAAPRAGNASREGVALIAVDGKPPKAYRVGAKVDEDTVLKSVRARGAELGPRDGAATITLEIAPPPPAATGVLPRAVANPPVAVPPAGRTGRPGVTPQPPAPPALGVPPPVPLPDVQPQAQPGVPPGGGSSEGLPRS